MEFESRRLEFSGNFEVLGTFTAYYTLLYSTALGHTCTAELRLDSGSRNLHLRRSASNQPHNCFPQS